MKINKPTALIVSLLSTSFAFANTSADFSNSKLHYSGFEIGYGSNDFDVGVKYSNAFNRDWSLLAAYNSDDNFDAHKFKLDFQNRDGMGVALNYHHYQDYRSEGFSANVFEFDLYNRSEMYKNLSLIPQVSVGSLKHKGMKDYVYYTAASVDMSYKITPEVWVGVTPEYTYSLGKVKEKNGLKYKLRDWDYTANIGYQINQSSALVYSYQYGEGDHLSLFSFKHTF
ncbi:hypothetical protein [Motilimonas sp. KMU-193]|uniref:hypothetical protein n=1 Tax=Motilimonas sp. KMU-193 TaxID=3388668 RepID=UPI00396B3332